MDLFDDFDLVKQDKQDKHLNKKRQRDNSNERDKNEINQEAILLDDQNPDTKIENRLKGLIDDKDLIKGSEEIKQMKIETFDVKGCTHVMFIPKDYEEVKSK
jgi:hypothetical protein